MKENGIDDADLGYDLRAANLTRKVIQMNYIVFGFLVLVCGFMAYQVMIAKNTVITDQETLVRLELEGAGVIPQSHDLSLRKENAQQTVVFTELNTKNGAPISVVVSTDTIDKERGYVTGNAQ